MANTKIPPELVDDQVFGRRNIIINGDMRVAQRATSVTSQTAGVAIHTVDRFYTELSGATVDVAQVTDAPTGYQYSQKVTMNGAFSASASQYVIPFETRIEGNELQRLSYGTSNAKKLTLSFWIKSSKTGTYTVEFSNNNSGGGKKSSSQYTISSANTWEHKTLTWVGDTSTAFEGSTAAELLIYFWAVAGTTYTSGTSPQGNSWDVGTSANRAAGVSGSAADDDYWAMTGVQLEVGDQATPFEYRSIGEELALCQRYFLKCDVPCYGQGEFQVSAYTTKAVMTVQFPVEMRVAPTVTNSYTNRDNTASLATQGLTNSIMKQGVNLNATINLVSYPYCYFDYTGSMDAEI